MQILSANLTWTGGLSARTSKRDWLGFRTGRMPNSDHTVNYAHLNNNGSYFLCGLMGHLWLDWHNKVDNYIYIYIYIKQSFYTSVVYFLDLLVSWTRRISQLPWDLLSQIQTHPMRGQPHLLISSSVEQEKQLIMKARYDIGFKQFLINTNTVVF